MFCDLVGSSALAQKLDAEDFHDLVQAYQDSCHQALLPFAAHVAQHLGDGLLVYFGFPHAHEDDPERAVRAGLAILDHLEHLNEDLEPRGLELEARIGIHTGTVVVGDVGRGERREQLALGDATNIAARLEGFAQPGAIVVSGETLRLVAGLFVTRDLGTPSLKGIRSPVRAYQVLRLNDVRSRFAARRGAAWTPCVGREQEIERLVATWQRTRDGRGQAVLMTGDAGTGKSRLVQELRDRLTERPHTWLEGHCWPYAESSVLHPIIDLLRYGLGLNAGASLAARRRRLEAGLEEAGVTDSATVALFAALLSLPMGDAELPASREALRRATFDAVVEWILALALRRPTVVMIEDLHWSDPSSLELLGLLIDRCAGAPVLLLTTSRPGREAPWTDHEHLTRLMLQRLSHRLAREMAARAAGTEELPADLVDHIAEHTGGIPLYVEEMVKMALETRRAGKDPSELEVPATLKDSLMARLDRLGTDKPLAQRAATLGREFPYRLLATVWNGDPSTLDAGLARLTEDQILVQHGAPPDAVFDFKHALIRDTAYSSLLRRQRRRIHGRIAAALEERFPERTAAEPEELARHLAAAGEARRAARAYERAGSQAAQRAAHAEAITHFRSGLAALDGEPGCEPRELALRMQLGAAMMASAGYTNEPIRRVWDRVAELAEALDDDQGRVAGKVGQCLFSLVAGDVGSGLHLARGIRRMARAAGDRGSGVVAHTLSAHALLFQGDLRGTVEQAREAVRLHEPAAQRHLVYRYGTDQGTLAHGYLAIGLWQLGFPDQALDRALRGVEVARSLDHPFSQVASQALHGLVRHERGEMEHCFEAGKTVIAMSERLRFPFWLGYGKCIAGAGAVACGDAAGVVTLRQGLASIAETGSQGGAPYVLSLLIESLMITGDHAGGLEVAEMALAIAEATGQGLVTPELLRLKAELTRASRPAGDETEALLRQSLELARDRGARSMELRAAASLARLLATEDRQPEGHALLAEVYANFTEGFETEDLVRAKALLEELEPAPAEEA